MAKGKPRWQKISVYELARDALYGKATSTEAEKAGRAALDSYRQDGQPQAHVVPGGKIVVR